MKWTLDFVDLNYSGNTSDNEYECIMVLPESFDEIIWLKLKKYSNHC